MTQVCYLEEWVLLESGTQLPENRRAPEVHRDSWPTAAGVRNSHTLVIVISV